MSVRLPSAGRYAAHVEIEHEWLPRLAARLPLPIPLPLGRGVPGSGYPWPWSVNRWVHGETASSERVGDQADFGRGLARFLNALQEIDATGAPEPGEHNFFRGGNLSVYDSETRECIRELGGIIDASAATRVWEAALESKWDRPGVWVHGDVAEGNLLVENGQLCGVIDFGQLAASDPACDVTIAWTFLSRPGRETFRKELNADEGTWTRGRGWGLWKALLQLRAHRAADAKRAARAEHTVREILGDMENE
jgi:aminoglycoside phosphotransferase (APT) family kinase protein